jgi:hypothetical protein
MPLSINEYSGTFIEITRIYYEKGMCYFTIDAPKYQNIRRRHLYLIAGKEILRNNRLIRNF